MSTTKKIISYILPVTAIVIVPSVILTITGWGFNRNIMLLIIGIIILIAGLILMIACIHQLETIGKGTLAPWSATSVLVKSGLYKYIRNPMITGVLIAIIGVSLISGSIWIALWALIFFIANTLYFKLSEEKGLIERFGDEYIKYRTETPIWIPKFKR